MADIYLSSVDGSDADNGSTWALAKATLAGALAIAAAGDTIWVDSAHNESVVGNVTFTSPGTAASPLRILCVDRTGNPEPPTTLATGALVARSNLNNSIAYAGFAYVYGVQFKTGNTASHNFTSTNSWWWRLENCQLTLQGSSSNLIVGAGHSGNGSCNDQLLELINTPISFGNANNAIELKCQFRWWNTASAIAGTTPDTLFRANDDSPQGWADLRGLDLSAMGSGDSIVTNTGAAGFKVTMENCKLGASVAITAGNAAGLGGVEVELINCDSADTNYRYCKKVYQGEITHETTIVRTGGASDGTTPISRKMVSSANSKFYSPLVLDSVVLWNEDTGSAKTVTVEIVTDNVTLTDAECWVEVEYLGTAGFPVSSFASDRAADILATPANQASSTETWTTTGLGTPVKQKLSVSFTPQEKGPVRVRVMLAKPSTTVYVDPPTELT